MHAGLIATPNKIYHSPANKQPERTGPKNLNNIFVSALAMSITLILLKHHLTQYLILGFM